MLTAIRRMVLAVRDRYRQTWFGKHVKLTRGLMLAQGLAIIALVVVVPYLIDANADADRYRDCVRRAESGAEIQATAIAGVEHAESTAALMDSIRDILRAANPDSAAVQAIDIEISAYVAGVAQFRRVAESYQPTTLDECNDLRKAA